MDYVAFRTGRKPYARPLLPQKRIQYLPGCVSATPHDVKFREHLVKELTTAAPREILEDGSVGASGIHTDWTQLMSTPGFYQGPVSHPPLHNKQAVLDRDLRYDCRPEDEAIWDSAFRFLARLWVEGSFRARNGTSAGFPGFESEGLVKKTIAEMTLAHRCESILRAAHKKDTRALYKDSAIVPAIMIQVRAQTDPMGNERLTLPYEGRGTNSYIKFNKEVIVDGAVLPGAYGMRTRTVFSVPWRVNCISQARASGYMRALFELFPKVFKHTTTSQVCGKLDAHSAKLANLGLKQEVFFSDVGGFDQTVRSWMIDKWFAALDEVWDPRITELERPMFGAAYFMRPSSFDALTGEVEKHGRWVGDPRRYFDSTAFYGLISGTGWVSFLGKVTRFVEQLCLIHRVTGDVLDNMEAYFKGDTVNTQHNAGDDTQDMGDTSTMAKIKQLREEGFGYFDISAEEGKGFIGSLYRETPSGWTARPRQASLILKTICPEHGIDDRRRAGWGLGLIDKLHFYSKDQGFRAVWDTFIDVWNHHYRDTAGDLVSNAVAAYEAFSRSLNETHGNIAYSRADMLVLDDEDRVHYAVDERDVSQHVLDAISTRVDDGIVSSFVSRYFGLTPIKGAQV